MTTLTEFLESKEVFIAVVIAISICVIGTIYFLIEKKYKSRKIEQDNSMDTKLVRVSDNQVVVEPVIDKIALDSKQDDVVIPVIEENKEKIKNEEVLQVEIKNEKNNVEERQELPKVDTSTSVNKEERLVIPIEEFNEEIEELTPSVSDIYEEVKDQVEQEKIEVKPKREERVEKLEYTEIEPNKEEAKEELRKVTEELIRTQSMQEQDNIDLTKFEEQQEEEAIISMDELMQKSKSLYEQNEVTQYEDEGNEPISLQDLESRMNKIKEEVEVLDIEPSKPEIQKAEAQVEENKTVKLDDFNTISLKDAYKEDRVFKSSPVISPIFGIEKKESTTNMELENTANYEKLDEEIKKTNEFLKVLKELQKKLD